jgi:sterol desaturase/sphingolipid hydroxylase (fatty acid hydroxylase superfamily)
MFWPLLLAHLIADYPLQSDWMVQAKKSLPGLALHVAVHLWTLLIILNVFLPFAWRATLPTVLAVVILHFAIDTWKNIFNRRWPQWVIAGYLQDQTLHVTSLLLVAYGQAYTSGGAPFAIDAPWLVYLCGFILVTYAWFVTERVLAYRDKAYQQWINAQLWPRLALRALLFGIVLVSWNLVGVLVVIGALAWYAWNPSWGYRWRALLIDSGVVVAVVLLLQLASVPGDLHLAALGLP